jgi:hypothetical protein
MMWFEMIFSILNQLQREREGKRARVKVAREGNGDGRYVSQYYVKPATAPSLYVTDKEETEKSSSLSQSN